MSGGARAKRRNATAKRLIIVIPLAFSSRSIINAGPQPPVPASFTATSTKADERDPPRAPRQESLANAPLFYTPYFGVFCSVPNGSV